jgi:putative transposase
MEYSIDLLPEEARTALIQSEGVFSAAVNVTRCWDEADTLTQAERDRSDAKVYVLKLFEAYRLSHGLAHRDARQMFPLAWKADLIAAPQWVKKIVPSLSKKAIDSWIKIRREQGVDALGIDQRGRPATIDCAADGRARMRLTALLAKNEFVTGNQAADYLRDNFSDELSNISTRTVQRSRARIEAEERNTLLYMRDPDNWRSKIELSGHKMIVAAGLNDLWEQDASPADVMLRGKKRHSIYMGIDVWSRRVKVLVTQTPRAQAVAALTRMQLIAWGKANRIKTDNGSDFTAKAVSRLMSDLGIEHELCRPYDPKGKPHVERAIKTFQHDLSICPGFIGHSVADRKKIEGRKAFAKRLGTEDKDLFDVDMDLVEFQAWCDEWADLIYANRDHGGLKKPAKTPLLKAASWAGEIQRIEDTDALNMLIAPIPGSDGIRRVTKKGIRIDNEFYMTKAVEPGADVFVRMDPTDLGRILLFSQDGETFLGLGICPPLAGEDPIKVAIEMKAAQAALTKQKTAEMRKEMRQIRPRDLMDAARNQAMKKASTLVPFERASTPYSTPALEAARNAGAALTPQTQGYTPEQAEQVSAAIVAMPKVPPTPRLTPREKMQWALGLEDQIAAGKHVDPKEMGRLQAYQESPEYRAWMKVIKKQGRAMLAG